jgi:hypothetical protein
VSIKQDNLEFLDLQPSQITLKEPSHRGLVKTIQDYNDDYFENNTNANKLMSESVVNFGELCSTEYQGGMSFSNLHHSSINAIVQSDIKSGEG